MTALAAEAASGPARVRWIQESGKELLFVDLSDTSAEQALEILKDFVRALEGRPKNSVLLLMDLTKSHYSPQVASRWKTALKAAKQSHFKASAAYGYSGMVSVALRGYLEALRLMGLAPSEGTFKTRPEALAWLVKQA